MARARDEIWDVAVIGGGIVGLSAALELQARGRRVVVIDRDRPVARASFGNGGVISRGSVLTVASPAVWRNALRYLSGRDPAVRIRWAALPAFAGWLAAFLPACNAAAWRRAALALSPLTAAALEHHVRLAGRVGASPLIRRTGYLKLYRTEAGFAAAGLEREILAAAGVRAEALDPAALADLEPSIRGVARGLFFPESASVDGPAELVEAYARAFRQAGGDWRAGEARAVQPGGEAASIAGPDGTLQARTVVIAAGAESARLLAPLGYRIPMAAERGYHRHFRLREGAGLRRPVHDVQGGYAASPIGGQVRLLSGIELARPDDPPDERQLRAVEPRARSVLPIGEPLGEDWMGSRPSIADGLPVIGRPARHPRLLLAFGHGHIGFSTGPLTGRIVADLESGQAGETAIAAFSPERFG